MGLKRTELRLSSAVRRLGTAARLNAAPYYLLDLFKDADGTGLGSHRMLTGAGWTVRHGGWTVTGNNAVAAGTADTMADLATADAGHADVVLTATVAVTAAGGRCGVIARYTDANNWWLLDLNQAGNSADIYEMAAGVLTQRDTKPFVVTLGTFYTLAAVCRGPSLALSVNGAALASYASAATGLTATNHGIRSYQGGSASYFSAAA